MPQIVTASELMQLTSDGYRYELIKGSLYMMSPAGGRHGRIAYRLGQMLGNHVDSHALGTVFAAETGFRVDTDPDTVLAPDVAFVRREQYSGYEQDSGYLPFAHDLAIEVLSPSDRFFRVEAKAFAWLDGGCKLVLIVDPDSETIHAYRSRKQIAVFDRTETINCTDAVTDWTLAVDQVFRLSH